MKDKGVTVYDTSSNEPVLVIPYLKLKNDNLLKQDLRMKILEGTHKIYCNCNVDHRIEKKIDIALRIYDAKKDTMQIHKYNCAGKPVQTKKINGCGRNEDGVLEIKYLQIGNVCNPKVPASSKNTPLITAIKNIQYEIWNKSGIYHYRKKSRELVKKSLLENQQDEKNFEIYENIIMFHKKIFSAMQENQIIINGYDLSALLYNTPNHKFKNLKEGEFQYFQMILKDALLFEDKILVKCINNFGQTETFVAKKTNKFEKILNINKNDIYVIAGFITKDNAEKRIIEAEIFTTAKRGLIATTDSEKILIDTFTDANIQFKCVFNFELTEFYHPMFIIEQKTKETDILYDLIDITNKPAFKEIENKEAAAKKLGLLYRYWNTKYTEKPYIPIELRNSKKNKKKTS